MISSRLLVSLCVLMVRLSMNSVSIMDIVYDGYHHIAVLMNGLTVNVHMIVTVLSREERMFSFSLLNDEPHR